MRPTESTLGGSSPTKPCNRPGTRRSSSKALRLPRRAAKRVNPQARAAGGGGKEGESTGEGRGGGEAGPNPAVGEPAQVVGEPEALLDVGTEPPHHGAGSSAAARSLRRERACFCCRRAWRFS